MDTEGHVLYSLRNATIKKWPYPHFYAENIFPEDIYWSILNYLKKKNDFTDAQAGYKNRTFSSEVDFSAFQFMNSPDFMRQIAAIFTPWMKARFGDAPTTLHHDLRLVRDSSGYKIGPHTDAPWKVVSLLFYLPEDGFYPRCGTSIYLPYDPDFRCIGGPHRKFEDFHRIYTAPYLPNTCFGFFKTDNSFHGVEPIVAKHIRRDVLLYNIYDSNLYSQAHPNTNNTNT